MERREVLRAMAVLAITPKWMLAQQTSSPAPAIPAPVPWTLGLNPRTPVPHTTAADEAGRTVASFFTVTRMATLQRLADVMVPRTERFPGALDAKTPEFLDFLIGHSPGVREDLYNGGLDWLHTQAQVKYRKPFSELSEADVDSLVKPWLRTWMTDHPPTEPHTDFINIAHADIRTATVNSQEWFNAMDRGSEERTLQLYWSPIDPDVYAERSTSVHTRPTQTIDAPRSSHQMRSFPR